MKREIRSNEGQGRFTFLLIIVVVGLVAAFAVANISPKVSVGVTFGIILFLITFLKPRLGLYIIVIAMLFSPEIPIGLIGVGVTKREVAFRITDFLMVAVAFGWLGKMAVDKKFDFFAGTPLNLPIFIFALIMCLSTMKGVMISDTVQPLRGAFFLVKRLQYFFIYFMVINLVTDLKQVKTCIKLLLLSGLIIAFIGVYQWFAYAGGAYTVGLFARKEVNILGAFLILNILLALSFFFEYKDTKTRLILITLLIAAFYALLFTASRAGYVSLFVALVTFAILGKKLKLLFIILVLACLSPILFPKEILEEIWSIQAVFPHTGVQVPSWTARVDSWKMFSPQILNYPFLGRGLGAFELAYFDNQYLQEALETGLFGVGCLIWILVRVFQIGYRLFKTSEDRYTRSISLGFIAVVVAYATQAITISNFYAIRTAEPFWFLVGLVMILRKLMQEEMESAPSTEQ